MFDMKISARLPDVYWEVILSLLILSAYSLIIQKTWPALLLQVAVTAIAAAVADMFIAYHKRRRLSLPKTGIISGLFIGMLLNSGAAWYLVAFVALLSILLKHLLVLNKRQIFNTAALGLTISGLIFNEGAGWWGASSIILITALGLILAYRMKAFNIIIPFFAAYAAFTLLLAGAHLGLAKDLALLSGRIMAPLIPFFAFFMLIEPRTTPRRNRNRIAYGAFVGALSPVFLVYLPSYSILGALLAGNLFTGVLPALRRISKPHNHIPLSWRHYVGI